MSRNLQLLHLGRGRLRLSDAETHIARSGVSAQTTKEAEDALGDIQHAIELSPFEHKVRAWLCPVPACTRRAQASQFKAARDLVAKAKDNGCELVAPYNKLGTELVSVFVQYRASTALLQRKHFAHAAAPAKAKRPATTPQRCKSAARPAVFDQPGAGV